MTGRNWASVAAVVWMILSLPKPAQPYGIAFVVAVLVWIAWEVRREMKQEKAQETEEV